MHYDTKVRIAEISVILVILLTIGSCIFFGISELSKQANIRKIQENSAKNTRKLNGKPRWLYNKTICF